MGLGPRVVGDWRVLRLVARRLANLRDEAATLGDEVLTLMIGNVWQEAASRLLRPTGKSSRVKFIPLRPTENGFPVAGLRPVVSVDMPLAKQGVMSADDFCAWQALMGWTDTEIARQLSISRVTVIKYKGKGAPRLIALAANALASGLAPWRVIGVAVDA